MSLYDKKVREYNNILKVLSGSRKKEHQKEMAEYHNNTQTTTSAMQSGRDAEGRTLATSGGDIHTNNLQNNSHNVIPSLSRNPVGMPKRDYGYAQNIDMLYKPQKPKSAFEQWNIEKTQPKLSYGAERLIQSANPSRNGWLDTTLRSYLSKPTNIDKTTERGYNKNAEWEMPNSKFTIPQSATLTPSRPPTRSIAKRLPPVIGDFTQGSHWWHETQKGHQNVGAIHESPVYDSAFKKNAENQWYNKIAHGSFKEDDWFNSMVKNQEKAQSWYNNTYGEKVGKKEYQNLHNRLINTPFDKIKEEEKQFLNYKASDFKVPELEPVNYSYSGSNMHKQETLNTDVREFLPYDAQEKRGKEANEIVEQWKSNLQNTTKGTMPSLSYINPLPKTMHIRPDKNGNSMIMDMGPFKVEPKGNPIFKLDSSHMVDGKIKDTHINTMRANQIRKSNYSPLQKKMLSELSHKEIPHWMYNAFNNFDDVAKYAKTGGQILGALGTAADLYELGSTAYEDLHDEDKKLGKKTAKATAGISGGWAGGAGGAVLGTKAGAALGTAITPGIGTAVGGMLGGIAGGIGGAFGGDILGRYAVDKLWK